VSVNAFPAGGRGDEAEVDGFGVVPETRRGGTRDEAG
jgi:hypothetical protein